VINIEELRQRLEMLADDELVSILQARDEEEWRPEVFDIVASILSSRGIAPAKATEPEGEGADEAEFSPLVTLAYYFSRDIANTERLALEAAGVKAWISDEYSHVEDGYHFGVRLQVREADFDEAMRILKSDAALSSELPPEIAEPACPKCGSRQVTEVAETAEVLDSSSTDRSYEREIWLYHCASCDYKWSEESG